LALAKKSEKLKVIILEDRPIEPKNSSL